MLEIGSRSGDDQWTDILALLEKGDVMPERSENKTSKHEKEEIHSFFHDPVYNLRREIDDVFSRFKNKTWPAFLGNQDSILGFGFNPTTDIAENDENYEICIELPGIDKKDISLTVNEGMLTIKGEKKKDMQRKEKNFHLSERKYGSFERIFRLPANIDSNAIRADFHLGVMTITAPKVEGLPSSHRKIEIKSH